MAGCSHTNAEHEAFKAPGLWETCQFIGYQPGDDAHGDLEMANVPGCESTICRRCLLTQAQRDEIRAAAKKKAEEFAALVAAALVAKGRGEVWRSMDGQGAD